MSSTGVVASSDRTCIRCGASAATPFCEACGSDAMGLQLPLVQPSPEALAAMHRVNLGAALLPGFWTFAHGAPVLGTLFWLALLPLPPVALGIMVYLFFNGSRVALQRRRFADPAQFAAVQRAWMIAGLITLPFAFLLFVLYAFLLITVVLGSSGASQ